MADKKIISIMGATGAQGGGLARAILADKSGEFAARAITRDANSDKARELAALGAEVVEGNLDDPESIKRAFTGAWGAFCVTFFWDHFSPDKEKQGARVMAEAAKLAGVRHVIWSTLEDSRKFIPLEDGRMPTLMEKYKVPHFDSKGEADEYFRELGVPATFLLTSFYWENFIYFGSGPAAGPDGTLQLTMPIGQSRLPSLGSEDIGKCALGIFRRSGEFIGKTTGIAAEHLTGEQMASAFSKALGREVRFNAVPADVYRSFGFPGAEDLGNMFQFNAEFEKEFCAARDTEFARSLNPEMQNFESWLARNASRIPIS